MATDTSIEWADKTWSPIIGCDRVSPGCDRCYAISTARIRENNPHPAIAAAFAGTTTRTDTRIDWSGRINLLEDRLTQPLHWKKPRKVFVNSLSDLFHKNVPDEFIAKVFATMTITPQHIYQILTKRHARMRSLLNNAEFWQDVRQHAISPLYDHPHANEWIEPGVSVLHRSMWSQVRYLPNVWLGVSVEDQKHADLRIPALLDTPAAIRFLSCEPLLGPVNLSGYLRTDVYRCTCGAWERDGDKHTLCAQCGKPWKHQPGATRIGWLIGGGESGHGARPAHPDWFRTLRDQSEASGVPFLFKQHGEWVDRTQLTGDDRATVSIWDEKRVRYVHPHDGRTQAHGDWGINDHLEGWACVQRVGKKAAGRELDGRTWDQFPEPR